MNEKILIVEDEFIVANDLRIILKKAGYNVCGVAISLTEARAILQKESPLLALLDIHLKEELDGIELARELREKDIGVVYLSANCSQQILEAVKATEPYGFLVKPYREKDLLVTLDIARYRHRHGLESRWRREHSLHALLARIIHGQATREKKFREIAVAIQSYIPFDYASLSTRTNGYKQPELALLRIAPDEYQPIAFSELLTITRLTATQLQQIQNASPPVLLASWSNDRDFSHACGLDPMKKLLAGSFQLASVLEMPVTAASGATQVFSFFSRRSDRYGQDHLSLLFRLQYLLAASLDPSPSASDPLCEGILGTSDAFLNVLELASQVAGVDTSVLLLGESGTGKEKIADCIHQSSPRKKGPFIKMNCAALPLSLVESELFGHEKGAFTGAVDRHTGKFEAADGGTIFLDEIGELPLEVQAKLLRVLQEKEIERLGGRVPIRVNVRIIAATNRNLEKEVGEGRFRLDLYYRLNVFPITLPPLRQRKEDIALLAISFAGRCCEKMKRPFHGISPEMMQEMEAYDWPGNIRQLENIIEQSVILNDGKSALTLRRPLSNHPPTPSPTILPNSLEEVRDLQKQAEIDYLSSILKRTNGRIRGKGGAAELTGQKPTTLESRLAKLGIKKEDFI